VPATDAPHRIQEITLPIARRSFTAENVSFRRERAQIMGFLPYARLSPEQAGYLARRPHSPE
jgi:hypothetical protein